MKPALEQIQLKKTKNSFKYFKRVTKSFTPYWHYHPELELTLIKKGQGTRFIGDSIRPFADLDLVLVGPSVPHHWVSQSNEGDQIAHVIQFRKELFSAFQECMVFNTLYDKAQRGLHYKDIPSNLVEEIEAFEHYESTKRLSALMNLLDRLSGYTNFEFLVSKAYKSRHDKTTSQLKFSSVNNYILEHLHKKLSLKEVAEIAHMVPQSFCRWFKQHSGHSFVNFVNITRVEMACQLILTSNLSIQEIAFSSGFESISHFNRTFKKIKGLSPRAYKSLHQKMP